MSSLKRRKLSLRGINSRPSLVTHIYYYTVISTLFTTFIQVFTIVLHKFQPKLQTIHELNFYYPRHVSCFIKGSIRLKRHEWFICIKIILNTHWLSILLSTWKICIKLRCWILKSLPKTWKLNSRCFPLRHYTRLLQTKSCLRGSDSLISSQLGNLSYSFK